MWGKVGAVDLSVIGNGYMIATFQEREDYFFALEGGPWMVQNHYLTVQMWKRNFNPWNEKIQKVAIWVRLPGLPRDYYDRKFFYNLGNRIGTAIKVGEMTLTKARTMYARMCVEVDLKAPLLLAYSVDGKNRKIEYEGLQLICFNCGRFGHDAEHCPLKMQQGLKERERGEEGSRPETENAHQKGIVEGGTAKEYGIGLIGLDCGPKVKQDGMMVEKIMDNFLNILPTNEEGILTSEENKPPHLVDNMEMVGLPVVERMIGEQEQEDLLYEMIQEGQGGRLEFT
ncbi:uncharacterized protein LOC114741406 [Neltuma alba]|uniref:uncharacterized protein LOC114741406 n=1 Tax=Neltuma alba TaxID=207710 RepID=UPI0010A36D16|nr:uncharacterized protein LOC114741406 [Prosopis alba]